MGQERADDPTAGGEMDTTGAEYLADDDRDKTTGYNNVPHHTKAPPVNRRIPQVRREAGASPPKARRPPEEG